METFETAPETPSYQDRVFEILDRVDAIEEGHFIGVSGEHLDRYIRKDRLSPDTAEMSQMGEIFAERFEREDIDVVVGPSVGAVALSQWVARHLSLRTGKKVESLFTDKTPDGDQRLGRGYDLRVKGKRVLVVEDVTTTGGSLQKVIDAVQGAGAESVVASVMVNGSPRRVTRDTFKVPFVPLAETNGGASYAEDEVPEWLKAIPINTEVGHGREYLEEHNPIRMKYEKRVEKVNSLLCVGLDTDYDKLSDGFKLMEFPQFEFNKRIIDATAEHASAFKLNVAFYEARGEQGAKELKMTMNYIRTHYPDIFTICDAKRADIGNTNKGYVEAIFDELGFDAITLHPYLGQEALQPFLDRQDKVSIILCRTSNPGAGEFQDLEVDGKPIWQIVAESVATKWNRSSNCMLVVGATYPEEMEEIRSRVPGVSFLVPGIGAQGGDVEATVHAGVNDEGMGVMINSSRGIIFADDPAEAARTLKEEINQYR